MRRAPIAVAALLAVAPFSGCANLVAEREEPRSRTEPRLIDLRYEFAGPEVPLRQAQVALTLVKVDALQDRTIKQKALIRDVTPYSSLRELYEVPVGAACSPIAALANAADLLVLGYLPNPPLRGFASYCFAALNRLLNTESAVRTESREISVTDVEVSLAERSSETPLPNTVVRARLGAGAADELRTDAQGRVSFHLLDLVTPETPLRPSELELSSDVGGGGVSKLALDPELASAVGRAAPSVLALADAQADPAALAQAVSEIARAGFRDWAVRASESVSAALPSEDARRRFASALAPIASSPTP
jgi:hypothetical protein